MVDRRAHRLGCQGLRSCDRLPERPARSASSHARSVAGLTPYDERSTDSVEAVRHALEAGAVAGRGRVESIAVVGDLEGQAAVDLGQLDGGPRRMRVLRDILECLEAAEIHCRLDLLRVPTHVVRIDVDRHR